MHALSPGALYRLNRRLINRVARCGGYSLPVPPENPLSLVYAPCRIVLATFV